MVRLLLSIRAELENVTELVPAPDSSSFEYFFEVTNHSSPQVSVSILTSEASVEEHQVTSGKGNTAHFVWRCGLCKRESSAKFDPGFKPQPYSADANGQLAPFLTIDCRGLEFIGFDPRGTWRCVGAESGTVFNEVELDEGEWVDYDEKVVSIPLPSGSY
ncbi:hypothetical protein EVJ58_g2882 [Rhodofomes roseus]|uniref:Uncharacterized protein n=1 Tax=Rhodofomes roseus TaxID=34475 RepID=A0A4Y9YQN2_9APHY|nr:hypothetical protein EVJ58_g2882 [Rhodofomes roseus]